VNSETLKVPKQLHTVTLWVHPEGRVVGSLFLREHSPDHAGRERPLEVLNQCSSFLVFKIKAPDELRFYNIKSIIRLEYTGDAHDETEETAMRCHLHMMDGSLISGMIREPLPADRARLLDYLNRGAEGFIKLHMDDGLIYIINKSYINHVHVVGIGDNEGEQ